MKTGIIIQARTGSTRLPNKIVKPFYNTDNILDIQIKKLKNLNLPIIVATTNNKKDQKIIDIAKSHNISYYVGSENDVLSRFVNAAKENKLSHIVRVCSDNPFIMIDLLKEVIRDDHKTFDYTSHFIENQPSITTHWGIFSELVSLKALLKIQKLNNDAFYKEHVTNYIYSHPEQFSIKKIDVTDIIKSTNNIRLTVDTENDFIEMKKLYKNYFDKFDNLFIEQLIEHINSELLNKMHLSIVENSKK